MIGGSRDAFLGSLAKTRHALTVPVYLERNFMLQRVVVHGLLKTGASYIPNRKFRPDRGTVFHLVRLISCERI